MSYLARTSQTREEAQYVFRRIQQNGCLALFHAVDQTMAHNTQTEALLCLMTPQNCPVSFTPHGSRLSVFFCILRNLHVAQNSSSEKHRESSQGN
jgi:hypothetical protein